jgi:Type II secretion system (T2SS), protein M
MNMSARDKKILLIIIPLVVVLGYWFLLLAPQRKAAADAGKTLQAEQARLAEAQNRASTVQAAKASFAEDYAAVVALGKAIPTSVDMPSLLVQLEQAAHGTGIEFKGVSVGERGAAAGAAAPAAAPTGTPGAPDPSAPTAPSGDPAQSAPGAAAGTAQEGVDAATTPPADPAAAGTATDPAAAGAAPPGSALEQVSLEFTFKGDFFALADFFHSLKRFVFVDGDKVRVRGRLMTINSVSYATEADSFPALTATVGATVFLTPKAEGVTAGATPAGPEAAPAAAAAPTSTASTDSTSPTPTATATP